MTAKELFRKVRACDLRLQAPEEAYQHALSNLGVRAVRQGEGGGGHGSGSPTEAQAMELAELESRRNSFRAYWIALRKLADEKINLLDNPREYCCLQLYYLTSRTWEQVAELLQVDLRTVYRIHGRALRHIDEKEGLD